MKRLILMFVALMVTFTATESFAAGKKENTKVTTTEFLTDIDCDHCVKKVMDFMPYQKGVKNVKVDLPTKVINVSYDNRKSSNEEVVKLFKKIDVVAKVVKPKVK
ncbi:MAG: cation transporter [Rikenellaceae bacterium]